MSDPIVSVDEKGVRSNALAQNNSRFFSEMGQVFGEDLSESPQTPQAQLAGIQALGATEIGEAFVELAQASDLDHASGPQLDVLGSALDIRRTVATRSRVTATVYGVAGTGVLTGSRAKTTEGHEFRTLTDVVLSPDGKTVEMESVELGPVPAAAGTLTQIVTVVSGWERITNAADATLGVARQGDEEYRRTYRARTARASVGPTQSVEAALVESGARSLKVVENNTDSIRTVQQWPLRPHSILAVAQSGSDGDITRAVETHRGMGAGTMTAIRGSTPDDAAIGRISNGMVTWGGVAYSGITIPAGNPVLTIAVTAGGTGYTSPPTVAITGGSGTGATATAMIDGGEVVAVAVTAGGANYTSAPTVSFSGGGGSGATATATLQTTEATRANALTDLLATPGVIVRHIDGVYVAVFGWMPDETPYFGNGSVETAFGLARRGDVASITVDNGGTGYTAAQVEITGGGGRGATATAAITAGAVSAITVVRAGEGYSSVPTVVITGDGSGAAATATINSPLPYPAGPFIRTRTRQLVVRATVRRRPGFPATGLEQLRDAALAVVRGYAVGEELWRNDILAAMERIPGTRVTVLTVQSDGEDVSGEPVPLDQVWSLTASNLHVDTP